MKNDWQLSSVLMLEIKIKFMILIEAKIKGIKEQKTGSIVRLSCNPNELQKFFVQSNGFKDAVCFLWSAQHDHGARHLRPFEPSVLV